MRIQLLLAGLFAALSALFFVLAGRVPASGGTMHPARRARLRLAVIYASVSVLLLLLALGIR